MPLIPRADKDAAALPDSKAERAALADFSDSRATRNYEMTLGDLIVEALIGRPLVHDVAQHPEVWEPFERALLQRTALDIRLAHVALAAHENMPTDDFVADTLSLVEISSHLRDLARRTEAAAELSDRLRVARWGHPSFGGGSKPKAAELEFASKLGREAAESFIGCMRKDQTDLTPEQWAKDAFSEPEEPWAFSGTAPSLDEESTWNAFSAGYAKELQKHGLVYDENRQQPKTSQTEPHSPANDGGAP